MYARPRLLFSTDKQNLFMTYRSSNHREQIGGDLSILDNTVGSFAVCSPLTKYCLLDDSLEEVGMERLLAVDGLVLFQALFV